MTLWWKRCTRLKNNAHPSLLRYETRRQTYYLFTGHTCYTLIKHQWRRYQNHHQDNDCQLLTADNFWGGILTSPHNLVVDVQRRILKLKLFPDADHPFKNDPRLVEWVMPPRNRRRRERLFSLPEGFLPMNPDAYRQRFSHMLEEHIIKDLETKDPAAISVPAKE